LYKMKKTVSWLKILPVSFALIPVIALAAIIVNLIVHSWPAITQEGWRLFSTTFNSSSGPHGLIPAMWGTFLVVAISMLIAVPVSLAMAIISSDFSFGKSSIAMRWILGTLSGIPPIIYAVMGIIFFRLFIFPKFAGMGLPPESLPAFDKLPFDSSATLLGGILLAMLLIPLIAPLLDDAIQSIPFSLKEASLSLGANRWHTLIRVTLPCAFPGISYALILGVLTALGEAIIVTFTIGLVAPELPSPLWDVLERVAPLTSTVAGIATGGFTRATGSALNQSVASFIGLLLLLIAFVILLLAGYFQKRFRKRFIQ
jgi:phosphate transport system permease protein